MTQTTPSWQPPLLLHALKRHGLTNCTLEASCLRRTLRVGKVHSRSEASLNGIKLWSVVRLSFLGSSGCGCSGGRSFVHVVVREVMLSSLSRRRERFDVVASLVNRCDSLDMTMSWQSPTCTRRQGNRAEEKSRDYSLTVWCSLLNMELRRTGEIDRR